MNHIELPDWVVRLRAGYEADPTKWLWAGTVALVLLIGALFFNYTVSQQKRNAAELMTQGLGALNGGNYAEAARAFDDISTSHGFSGLGDQAQLLHAASLFGLGQYAEAEAAYGRAAKSSEGVAPEADLGIGACKEMLGDTAGALSIYEAARARYPESYLAKAFDIRIARLSLGLGNTGKAQAIYDTLETDTDGLWKEIARGNRRMVAPSTDTGVPPSDTR